MRQFMWRLLGEQCIYHTTFPLYRQIGRYVEVTGKCYRITHVHGDEVSGRPRWFRRSCDDLIVVQSPFKHVRRQQSGTMTAGHS